MSRLTIQNGPEKNRVLLIRGRRATVGRSIQNDIQIIDRRMSRCHAEFFLKDGNHFIRDLGSKNGTIVNGMTIREPFPVHTGDEISMGDTLVLFEEDGHGSGVEESSRLGDSVKGESSAFRLVNERQWGATRGEIRASPAVPPLTAKKPEERIIEDSHSRLEIIYRVTEAIRNILDAEELLATIINIVEDVLDPENVYLLMRDEESGELRPEMIRSKEIREEREVAVSTSIVDRCLNEAVSLLVSDAAVDDRFAAAESVILNKIRSAIAAPLVHKGETMGVIYVDTRSRVAPYTQEELELLTGIASQAAMAIMNARLHGQIVEQHKLAREMEIARTIQMNLLPRYYPDLPGFDVSAMSLPAKQVGGDYYDFLSLEDGRTGVAIADVSGKGVPAAILTAGTRSYIQSEAGRADLRMDQMVRRINSMIHRDVTDNLYVTMFLLFLEPSGGGVEYVNAGHCHPVLVQRDGTLTYLDTGGLFLGLQQDAEYETGETRMDFGDVLLLFTDGVTDIQNAKGERFGGARLEQILKDCRLRPAEDIRNAIYQACIGHRGDAEQFDDFTMIVLKRLPGTDSAFEDMDIE